jgi:MFS family permease
VRSAKTEAGWGEALRLVSTDRKFLRMLGASLIIAIVFYQMTSTFGLYITQQGLSAATYGTIISLNGVLVVLFELPLTTLTRRFPARRIMAVGYVLIGIGSALNIFAHSALAFASVMLVFTLGEMIAMPVSSAYIADLAPADVRGRYMGTFGLTWAFALVWGPALSMRVFERSPSALWISCGLLGLVAALIISVSTSSHSSTKCSRHA